ncbi:MAG TPA: ABC transporter permease [Gemmatimonadaceae bacterium]|nr:ABC transporter permease [Gemmatimonadaceae bacterium]
MSASERAFALLTAALFPREFRARFGEDMRELFRDQSQAARSRGGAAGVVTLWLHTIPSLTRAALLERRDALRKRFAHAPTTTLSTTTAARCGAGSDTMLGTIASDLRFAGRMLRKSPVFTAVAVLTISLGSGAVTTIYSAMNALLFRPLPGTAEPARLVHVEPIAPDGGTSAASHTQYRYLRDGTRTLDGLAAWGRISLAVAANGEGASVYGNMVSANYFAVLGVRPLLGRFFLPEEDRTPLTHPVVVVSEAFWRSHLGADSGAVGRTVLVNGRPYTLIGVAPSGFRGIYVPMVTDAWVPLMMQHQLRPGAGGSPADLPAPLRLFARLKAGASEAAARRELEALGTAWAAEAGRAADYARSTLGVRVYRMTGLPDDANRALFGFAAVLFGAAALVLLIASVNVASMLSARAVARQREMAVRTALGAGRGRLVRQLLTEILLLFGMGAVGGVLLAMQATAALERLPLPSDPPVSLELSPDPRVLAFALLVSLLTGLLFGLAPALRGARTDVASLLRDGSAASGTRRRLAGNALIVGQLALSLVLLVAAGLLLRALGRGSRVDPGFDLSGVAVAPLNTESWGYDATRGREFYRALREQVAALPGVTAASYTMHLQLTMHHNGDEIQVDGAAAAHAPGGGDRPGVVPVWYAEVDADYFAAMRVPLLRGRDFAPTDDERAPGVAIVNETLARQLWPDGSALGRTFGFRGKRVTIIGIARDAKYHKLDEATPPFVYFPLAQLWEPKRTLLVRTSGDPRALGPAIQRAVHAIDPALPRPVVSTLREETSIVLLPQRVAAMVTGVLGGMGFLLAAVGLYGVIAYSVSRRMREIGIRVAIGARRSDVLGMVIGEGMRLAAVGVAIGVVLAAAAARLLASLLFDVSPLDAVTFSGVAVLFAAVALVASYLPARRAAAADPMAVIRAE